MLPRIAIALALLMPGLAWAHEASQHKGKPTEGEVVAVDGDKLALKTATGETTVKLTDATKFEREDGEATRVDLTKGTHVAVFGTKLASGELVAREVVIHAGRHG